MPASQTAFYGTPKVAKKMRQVFGDRKVVKIGMRNCDDVPKFLQKLDGLYAKTRKHSSQFD